MAVEQLEDPLPGGAPEEPPAERGGEQPVQVGEEGSEDRGGIEERERERRGRWERGGRGPRLEGEAEDRAGEFHGAARDRRGALHRVRGELPGGRLHRRLLLRQPPFDVGAELLLDRPSDPPREPPEPVGVLHHPLGPSEEDPLLGADEPGEIAVHPRQDVLDRPLEVEVELPQLPAGVLEDPAELGRTPLELLRGQLGRAERHAHGVPLLGEEAPGGRGDRGDERGSGLAVEERAEVALEGREPRGLQRALVPHEPCEEGPPGAHGVDAHVVPDRVPDHAPGERQGLVEVGSGEQIDLVHHEQHPGGLVPHLAEERHLRLGDRRVRGGEQDRRVDLAEEGAGGLRVRPVDAPDPRGVHEERPTPEQLRGVGHLDPRDPPPVPWVAPFRDEGLEVVDARRLAAAVAVAHGRRGFLPPADHGRDGGQRDRRGRQDIGPEEGVHEGGLAAL